MNTAFSAGCLFILQCSLLMDIAEADPLIDVSPSEINLGVTSSLDINCTFSVNSHPDMAAFISLVLSRANATGHNIEELAAIKEFSPDNVNVLTQEKVSASGVLSQTGESFLHITWEYSTAMQGGVYECSATGIGMIGHNVEMTNISSVTVDEANLSDILKKLQLLQMHESSMEQQIQTLEDNNLFMEQRFQNLENYTQTLENDKLSMEQRIQTPENYTKTLENDKISMENQISDLKERNNSHLESVVALLASELLNYLGSHGTKSYYVSNYAFGNVTKSIDVSRSLGGQLAVVDDQDELTALQNFLTATSGISHVVIAGTDERSEGNWVLPETNNPLPFMAWASYRPYTDGRYSAWDLFDVRICLFMVNG